MVAQGSAAARKPVQMSFLGVGAPEAILVAVVALVVFGPKGLADAARSLGSALRAFQPTIKEVVQVSQELKGTLEKELGIDELRDAARPTPRAASSLDADLNPGPAGPVPDVMAKVMDPEIEAKRAASAQMAWGAATSSAPAAAPEAPAAVAAPAPPVPPVAAAAPAAVKDIASMSMEELEAELARRRTAGADKRQ
ncbi:hypothetical protein GPECTOR_79g136 [Gonium pectorale]|uniref:Sec-independent protein translocase protein TatA n=1 Tax=Gonium pectorale TaxID=33097 RepID=A0A150G1X7_GONPE|nr:hypothetical protein GPECTOR_79g136 [Gonium pectorale]|eukprot:KXZ43857.1 hypothetical protein GPECTOR_79g136 [Gonium pectorale]